MSAGTCEPKIANKLKQGVAWSLGPKVDETLEEAGTRERPKHSRGNFRSKKGVFVDVTQKPYVFECEFSYPNGGAQPDLGHPENCSALFIADASLTKSTKIRDDYFRGLGLGGHLQLQPN